MTPRLTRRRLLTVAAAALASGPAQAGDWTRTTWRGRAMGAEARITLSGPPGAVAAAMQEAVTTLRRIEALYSLYDPRSALSRLNASGTLAPLPGDMHALLRLCGQVHERTGGLFDPTVQPLWRALAEGRDTGAARAALGWPRVRLSHSRVTLDSGQALTLNGIAQGAAADGVVAVLQRYGLGPALVNTGEMAVTGGAWRVGLSDPRHGHLGQRQLTRGAIATSSPGALSLGDAAHILHPAARPLWSTVSVEADSAALADALSTAACLMPLHALADLPRRMPGLYRITLVDAAGDIATLI